MVKVSDNIRKMIGFIQMSQEQKDNIINLMQKLRISENKINETIEYYGTDMYAHIISELNQQIEKFNKKRTEIINKIGAEQLRINPNYFVEKYGKKLNEMNYKELKMICTQEFCQ